MEDYNDLKEYTYLYFLNNSIEVEKLISSMLLILYYNDKCLEKDERSNYKLLVSEAFIKDCNKKILFLKNGDKIAKLNEIDKFKLLRDKIAHGDFVINPNNNNLVFKIRNGEVDLKLDQEIETEVSQKTLFIFGEAISNYYRYLSSDLERKTIYIKDGLEYEFIDIPKKGYQRNNQYNYRFSNLVDFLLKPMNYIHYELGIKSMRNKTQLSRGMFNVRYTVKETDKKDMRDYSPYQKEIEKYLFNRTFGERTDNCFYEECIDNLIDFYKYYIYPLENFLKDDDKNIESLQNEEMFNFESLSIPKTDNIKNVRNIGKVDSYNNDIERILNKLNKLQEKKDNYESNQYYKDNEKINELTEEIDSLISILLNSSVVNSYNYNKNRSTIETIRCAITHGSYDCNEEKKEIVFKDDWHNKNSNLTITSNEFKSILSRDNKNKILNQYETVYQRKIY